MRRMSCLPPSVPTVLVVDDTRLTLARTRSYLESRDMRVVTTSAATEVVGLAERHRPDLIVLDYEMPVMNGDEVCRGLKSAKATSGIPIIVLTSHDDAETDRRCREAGASLLVSKSEGREALLEAVARALRRHR